MLNSPGNQGHSLGLSVGATNLAATRDGQTAVIRPAELTLQGQRLTGFVDRVGDPVPLVAPDGSKHRSEELLADALGAMAHAVTAGVPVSDVAVTVPAHWRASVVDTLRRSLRGKLPVISDATAALTTLRANPGLPTHGVIVLCDFGGSGTSITLANAARDFSPFGETVRFPDFSGDQIDQALLTHVVAGLVDASHADPSGTAMVGSLVRLRDECRRAKERLSESTATAVVADLPDHRVDLRVTRTELEDLMAAPLSEFLAVLGETLERYGVPAASVSAVATVGGGARIPLITQRLSEHLRAPVVTTAHPQLTAAEGAALIAHRSRTVDTATTLTPTAPAAAAATATLRPPNASTALAWSEDDVSEDVLPYSDLADSRPEVALPPRGMAGRGASAAQPACAVRSGGGRRRHRDDSVRHQLGQRHHHDPGRCGNRRVVRSRACGVGASPSSPGAAGPPSHDRCSAKARATVVSGAAAAAGAGDAAIARTGDDSADDHHADHDHTDDDNHNATHHDDHNHHTATADRPRHGRRRNRNGRRNASHRPRHRRRRNRPGHPADRPRHGRRSVVRTTFVAVFPRKMQL